MVESTRGPGTRRAIAAFAAALLIGAGCDQHGRNELYEAYAPGSAFDISRVPRERIALDTGVHPDQTIRTALVGYSEPETNLMTGERLVILVEGEWAVFLYLDREGRVLRTEVERS